MSGKLHRYDTVTAKSQNIFIGSTAMIRKTTVFIQCMRDGT